MIIDAHVHVFPPDLIERREEIAEIEPYFELLYRDPRRKLWTSDDLVRAMDAAEVDKAFVMNFGWYTAGITSRANDYILESASRFPGRILPLISLPLADFDFSLRELERCLSGRPLGVGELMPDGQGYSNQIYESFTGIAVDIVVKERLLVAIHGSEPLGHAYPGKGSMTPDKLFGMAADNPDIAFLFAHFGGGLPFYALMPEVEESTLNVWYDTAAAPFLYRSAVYPAAMRAAGADRVLFGSDAPLLSYGRALHHVKDARMNDLEVNALMHDNASTLLETLGW